MKKIAISLLLGLSLLADVEILNEKITSQDKDMREVEMRIKYKASDDQTIKQIELAIENEAKAAIAKKFAEIVETRVSTYSTEDLTASTVEAHSIAPAVLTYTVKSRKIINLLERVYEVKCYLNQRMLNDYTLVKKEAGATLINLKPDLSKRGLDQELMLAKEIQKKRIDPLFILKQHNALLTEAYRENVEIKREVIDFEKKNVNYLKKKTVETGPSTITVSVPVNETLELTTVVSSFTLNEEMNKRLMKDVYKTEKSSISSFFFGDQTRVSTNGYYGGYAKNGYAVYDTKVICTETNNDIKATNKYADSKIRITLNTYAGPTRVDIDNFCISFKVIEIIPDFTEDKVVTIIGVERQLEQDEIKALR